MLGSRNAYRFRVVITNNLLSYFKSADSVQVRCLAKFISASLHMLLSKSEICQFSLLPDEIKLVENCTAEVETSFFVEINHLQRLRTLKNLSLCSRNCESFVETGIMKYVVGVALSETGFAQELALGILMNMIITGCVSSNLISMLRSFSTFTNFIGTSNTKLCKGLQILTSAEIEPGR